MNTEKLKRIKLPNNSRPKSSRKASKKSPMRGTTLVSKFKPFFKFEKTLLNESTISATNSVFKRKLINITPRPSCKIKINSPLKTLRFPTKIMSPGSKSDKKIGPFKIGNFLKHFRDELSEYELGEILDYKEIYY